MTRVGSPEIREKVREKVREIESRLQVVDGAERSALHWFIPALRELTKSYSSGAYSLASALEGPCLEFLILDGGTRLTRPRESIDNWLHEHRRGFGAFDPRTPEPSQRNKVLVTPAPSQVVNGCKPRWMPNTAVEALEYSIDSHYRRVDWDRPTARVLICDGPRLLAYIGITEETRFTSTQLQILRALVSPLQRRLLLERRLHEARFAAIALEATLGAVPAAAAIVRRGIVQYTNAVGRAWFAAHPASESFAHGWDVTRLAHDDSYLVVRRHASRDIEPRVVSAARRWTLTPRQHEVLGLLARGATNLRIAGELGCAEATVEIHVSRILARADVATRAELIAEVWSIGPG
jgi:DNA-binding CsgD family transcriptional regulator